MVYVNKATVLFSGGIDSAACAHMLKSQKFDVETLFVDFGQAAARKEYEAACLLAQSIRVPLKRYALVGDTTSFGAGELVGRNAFLAFSALLMTRGESAVIALGLHAGTPYFDCSPVFLSSISKIVAEHTDGKVSVIAPFISWNKKEVFDYFQSTELSISHTYSCEIGADPPCGTCSSCKDREALGC
jgi:7-cyano-7-deazaguanine synthase